MTALDFRTRLSAGIGLWLACLAASSTPSVAGTCPTPVALSSGSPVSTVGDPAPYSLTPVSNGWSAVGVRSNGGSAWNLQAFDATGSCFSGELANSATSSVDFLVTDWHNRPGETDYVVASTPDGNEPAATVEFEQADFQVVGNMPFTFFTISSDDVVKPLECSMLAGVTYFIEVVPSKQMTGLKLFLFEPASTGSGWLARNDALIELTLFPGGNGLNFTPTTNGVHGLMLVNEDAESGDCYVAVGQCPISSSNLAHNVPFFLPALNEWPNFTQDTASWGVVAVRGEPGYTFLIDVAPGLRRHDALFTTSCTDSVVAFQYDGITTHLVTGDFRSMPLRTYSARAGLAVAGYPTSSAGHIEWESGADSLTVDAPPLAVTPPAHNIVDAWRIRLSPDASYDFNLTPAIGSTANYRLMLFRNPSPGSPYWANRYDAVFETGGGNNYHPIESDVFGLMVINDNAGTGNYTLSVTSSTVDVPDGAAPVTSRIRSASPNPTAAGASIAFELAHPAEASIAIRDARGRLVASVPLGLRPAGRGIVAWDALGSNGRRLPAAVYFLGLTVYGRSTGSAKVVVIN